MRTLDIRLPSRTTTGTLYDVHVTATSETCGCMSFRMRGRCAHAVLARRIFDDPTGTAIALAGVVAALRIAEAARKRKARA